MRQNLNCVFFDITDEEDRDQQEPESWVLSGDKGRGFRVGGSGFTARAQG